MKVGLGAQQFVCMILQFADGLVMLCKLTATISEVFLQKFSHYTNCHCRRSSMFNIYTHIMLYFTEQAKK